jgi:multiple sugar transport system permease protein
MLSGSFKPATRAIMMPPEIIPRHLTFENYIYLFEEPVVIWIFNSFVVAILGVIGAMLINTMAGYAFAKKKIPAKEIIFWCFVASMMIPGQINFIPLFLLIKKIGLYNTRAAMIIPGLSSAFFIFFLRQYLKDFPNDLLWTAEIDGCSELGKFFRVVIPLSKPGIAVMATMAFIGHWMNFFWQLVIVNKDSMKTLPVGVATLVLSEKLYMKYGVPNYGLSTAGATMSFLPLFIVFILFQKYFQQGIFEGALKE